MFRIILSCISQLWELLCESMSFTTNSQTPPSSPLDSMPSPTISQTPSSSVSYAIASTSSQTPSSSPPDSMASTTNSQTQLTIVSGSTPTKYDVFLSFRGKDTRLNFTSHLYDKLDSNGIRTFKDEPELRGGEVISNALLDAIRKSKSYIVVLSENYASSSWCLDELAEILNCQKTAERLVIPVFYKIDPSVVRYQTGTFKQAFKKHQNRFVGERDKVNNWRVTLTEVANFSGHHISEDRSEADVINKIVDELLLKLNPKVLDVAKYPVGLDSRVNAMTTLLSSDKKGVIKFGIYGMAGVGKTTLAKALYNRLLKGRRFKGSCFLANVREASETTKGLVSLQQQLINDVLMSTTEIKVHNVDEGINYIRERISSAKVLILIDDIYDLEQYESLAGPFASESVVIITTRDEEMLDKVNIEPEYRYMLKVLDYAQSRELFTKYAFEKVEPPNNLLALYEDILGLAGGLPLALKIFGSYLSTKKEVGWKSYIKTLQQNPNSTIEQKLVISLDTLESDDRMLKKIFIDIACFFIGWNTEQAVKILETYYFHVDDKMDTLKKRCLLTMNKKLEMHDLLRDVGRNVARNNALNEPGKYSRLWLKEDIWDVLKNHKGTEVIEGIIAGNPYEDEEIERFFLLVKATRNATVALNVGESFSNETFQDAVEEGSFSTKTFERMSKLRFLYVEKVYLTGSFKHIFEDLRVLYWKCCPLKCLPCDFYPEKLVILELPQSNMRTMWDLNMVPHVFRNLKTLNMSYSQDLITSPDFIKLPCLETLNLEDCKSLEEVHISIGSLVRLESLNLGGCKKLTSLPGTICNLRALEVLTISRCSRLKALPIQLGNIKSLTELNANGLTISRLPDSIGNLTRLVELNLSDNMNIKTLPDSICNLRSLEILDVNRCSDLEALPTEIGNIESLRRINLRDLLVSKLPDSIGSLTKLVELDLSNNKNLETLPDTICNLRYLEIISINRCEKLKTFPDQLWEITNLRKLLDIGSSQITLPLQKLDLSYSGITALPSGFGELSSLEYLHLSFCNLFSIPKLPPNLKRIDANGSKSLERLPNLSNLKRLEVLNLSCCSGFTEILGLEELTALRELYLTNKHLTKRLFKVYSEFEHQVSVYISKFLGQISRPQWPGWITESPYWSCQSSKSESTTVYAHLLPNESHNFMGIILCFKKKCYKNESYSVKNTTSGFIWSDRLLHVPLEHGLLMVIVPKSIFPVRDEDHRIEFTADNVKIDGIHLLYNMETEMIEDVEKHVIDIDALKLVDPVLQDMFLDIACFFIRWKKKKVIQILETYYNNVDHNIDILKKTCLLKINDRDELEMDDLLQHLGRKSARNNFPDEPGKHSRLWLLTDIYEVFKNHKGTEVIEGIVPHKVSFKGAPEGESYPLETFQKMRKLRFLYLKKVHLTGSFEQTFEDLRWLCWDGCPLKCLPSEFYSPKLVILELPHSNITTWELNMVSHVFEKLKTLDMSNCKDLTATPDFTKLPCLETLILEGCESLEEIHISIGSLARLVSLDLHGCVKLKSLPDTICNLRALEFLCIGQCSNLEALPREFGDIESLSKLNAYGLTISELPNSIRRLSKLVKLRLSSNKNLETLPDTICSLRSLETLDISDCGCLEALPAALGELQSLRELKAEYLTVPKLPDSIGHLSKLVELRISCNKNLETLPVSICNLRSLEILDISGCEKLEILPDQFCNVTSLRELIAGGATLLKMFPYRIALSLQTFDFSESLLTALPSGFSQLSNLEDLKLKDCRRLFSIAELPRNLKWIRADGCMSLKRLPNLSNLKQLEYLNLENCRHLTEIQGLKGLASIKRLYLKGCNSSLLANIFTESFFQMYSEFGNPIQISSTKFPVWIFQSSNYPWGWGSTMFLDLPNVSRHFLGMILCFKTLHNSTNYYVKNTTSDFIWRGNIDTDGNKSLMVIVPRSIFSVEDGDDGIELITDQENTHGIYLLYKSEEYDSTTVNED